jgi:hypothetical protein
VVISKRPQYSLSVKNLTYLLMPAQYHARVELFWLCECGVQVFHENILLVYIQALDRCWDIVCSELVENINHCFYILCLEYQLSLAYVQICMSEQTTILHILHLGIFKVASIRWILQRFGQSIRVITSIRWNEGCLEHFYSSKVHSYATVWWHAVRE